MDHTLEAAAFVVRNLAESSLLKARSGIPNGDGHDASTNADAEKESTKDAGNDSIKDAAPASSSHRPSRGALLSQLEFLRQAKDNGLEEEGRKLIEDSPADLIATYFRHFGDKPSFFADVKTWLPLIQGDEINGLVEKLAPEVHAENLLESPVNAADVTFPISVREGKFFGASSQLYKIFRPCLC